MSLNAVFATAGTLAAVVDLPHISFGGVLAGMPSFTLSDLAEMRVQSISFFLAVLLLGAWGVKGLWNGLRRDFPRLPRLGYRRALMLVALWGLVFMLVLSMISGARELMTPGAWERDGLTYKLAHEDEQRRLDSLRWSRIAELKVALWEYASSHDGHLPVSISDPELPRRVWESADVTAAPFEYTPGSRVSEGEAIVATEPAIFPPPRLALFSDGTIRQVSEQELVGGEQ